jgi:hypothetical protein
MLGTGKCLGIADQNFEMAKKMCSAQLSKDEWWCWNFTSSIKEDVEWPLSALPKYRRVRSVKLKSNGKTDFLWCDCGFYGRVGIPCSHVFRISQSMYLENFHVRHWKMFDAFFCDGSKLGELMVAAQVSQVAMCRGVVP